MQPPSDFRRLTEEEFRLLEERADRFAVALQEDPLCDWDSYLNDLSDHLRLATLHEFIKIDLERRWKSGDRAFLDDYLRRFPELGSPYDLPVHLIFEEYRIRHSLGDKPESDSYFTRFPHAAETLRGLMVSTPATRRDMDNNTQKSMPPIDGSIAIPRESNEDLAPSQPPLGAPPDSGNKTRLPAVGEYQLMEVLGRGQFGEVWRAMAPGGVEVAVKVITQPADRETARRELQALELVKNFRHPCLLSTLAFWEHQNKLYIVCELADGTLRDLLKKSRQNGLTGVPRDELIRYFADAAEGLDYLHSKHIFHRDIKPDNILLIKGHAKVADFGLARAYERPDLSVSFAGTPVYMAPEVWGGKFQSKSDQYALAFTYAELRLGRRPLDGKDFVELMSKQLDSEPDLDGLPDDERAVLSRALAKQPVKRFTSCSEFIVALRSTISSASLPAVRPSSRKSLLVGGGILAAGAVGATLYFLQPPPAPSTNPISPEVVQNNNNKQSEEPKVEQPPKIIPENKPPKKDPPIAVVPKSLVVAPAGFTAVDGAGVIRDGNREIPKRIEKKVGDVGTVSFILIEPPAGMNVKPYYLMETKVWNGLARNLFSSTNAPVPTRWQEAALEEPITLVTLKEAVEIAKALGGRLPTPAEWDMAIGFDPRNPAGSFSTRGRAAVGLSRPRPVHDLNRDRLKNDLSDMLGNSREWTAQVIEEKSGKITPLPENVPADALIVLRGRVYSLAKELTPTDLLSEQKTPQTQKAGTPSRYTSFRIALDLPGDPQGGS